MNEIRSPLLLVTDNRLYYVTGQSSKKTARGLFRSLFCCFSKGQRTSNVPNGSTVPDGRISPPVIIGSQFLLPPVRHQDMHKKCMVIDLDETLVHSSFKVRNISY